MGQFKQRLLVFIGVGANQQAVQAESHFRSVAQMMSLPWRVESRSTDAEIEDAHWVVVLGEGAELGRLQERLRSRGDTVEFWANGESAVPIEQAVMDLVARLLGGGKPRGITPSEPATSAPIPPSPPKPPKPITLKVGRETAGRRGKGVTTIFDMPFGEAKVQELAGILKQRCGTGGTVKGGRIEIQGDQRERIIAELEKLGYKVKRVGG